MIVIQEISFNSPLYPLTERFREEILRRPLKLALSPQDVQGEDGQIHIAAVGAEGEIAGTVLLKPVSAERVKLRQMAVAPSLRGAGVGRDLVQFAERLALAKGFRFVEMHARISAQAFYEKLGYQAAGLPFIEVTVPTIKMTKTLGA